MSATFALTAGATDVTDTTRDCVQSHASAQRLKRDGKLRDARLALVACSREQCPSVIVNECSQWLSEVERQIPSFIVSATTPDGRDAVEVRVFVDGKQVASRLDGKPIEVDPGSRELRYEYRDYPAVVERVLFPIGGRDRRVMVKFGPPVGRPPERKQEETASTPTGVYVLGAIGLVGLASAATFGTIGLARKRELDRDDCAPDCKTSDVDPVRRSFLIADISLAVGVAALGAASVIYLTRPKPGAESARFIRAVPRANGFVGVLGSTF